MLYRGVAVLLLLLCTSCTADSASKIAKLRQQLAEAEAEAAVQISETSAARLQSNSSWILDPEKCVLITVLVGLATLLWWLKRPSGPTEPPLATLPYSESEQRAIDDERKAMITELQVALRQRSASVALPLLNPHARCPYCLRCRRLCCITARQMYHCVSVYHPHCFA